MIRREIRSESTCFPQTPYSFYPNPNILFPVSPSARKQDPSLFKKMGLCRNASWTILSVVAPYLLSLERSTKPYQGVDQTRQNLMKRIIKWGRYGY